MSEIRAQGEVFKLREQWDSVRTVEVHCEGSRYGVVPFPECALFDPLLKYGDRGILAYIMALRGAYPWHDFLSGVGLVPAINSLERIWKAGYLSLWMDVERREDWCLHLDIPRELPIAYDMKHNDFARVVQVKRPKRILSQDEVLLEKHRKLTLANLEKERAKAAKKSKSRKDGYYKPEKICPSNVPQELWDEFISFRRGMGFSCRKKHMTTLVRRLEDPAEFAGDPEGVLRQSIDNGWRGLFPVKMNRGNSTSTQILSSVDRQIDEDEL